MIIHTGAIEVSLRTGPDIVDITGELRGIIQDSGIADGVVLMNVVGSTGSLTTIEYEPGVVQDLKDAVGRMAPKDMYYAHEEAWHDGNGHSHVQAALMGPSMSVAVRGGRPALGTWQQAVVVNHDNKSRTRRVEVTVIGK